MAEAAIGAEVELRLGAACSNRGLWPRPIKEEVERLEQRLGSMQVWGKCESGRRWDLGAWLGKAGHIYCAQRVSLPAL